MKIYSVSIPVPSYDHDDVVYEDFLFTTSPTKQQVINVIETAFYDEADPYYVETLIEHVNNLKNSIDQVKDWIMLNNSGLLLTNTHVNVTLRDKTVKAPFSWSIVVVYTP